MATQEQVKKFIAEFAPCAQYAYKTLGKVLPSVCIGMACVESAYGTAGSVKHHSYLGQKVGTGKTATKYWDKTFFTSKTQEEYTVGQHTVIKAAFRSYRDMQQCALNYYELLNTGLYARVKANADYKTQMAQIKTCGYMTSSTEVNSVIRIIEKYNLTQYDGKPSYPVPTRLLKRGCKGDDVKWLQTKLNENGFNLIIDGDFGVKTEDAVRMYQNQHGLVCDGLVGNKTRSELMKGE